MRRIKFCHIIDASTANPLLYNSIKHSDRKRFEYKVVSLAPHGVLHSQMAELGVDSLDLGYSKRAQAPTAFWRLFQYLKKERIEIVQTHLFDASLIGLSAARLARIPVRIFTGHHSAETPLHGKRMVTWVDGLSPRFLANRTIAPSAQMKEIFIRDVGVYEEKVAVIPHGFDLEGWRSRASEGNVRNQLGLGNQLMFLAAGRLSWTKDYRTMIEGFEASLGERDDAILAIAGGGDDTLLRSLPAAKRLGDRLVFLGPRNDIASVMNACDVFVHTSLAESFGMVYIEAFALGKPLICTPTGIARDIVRDGKNGYLVRIGDAASVSEAVTKILSDRDRAVEMGAFGCTAADEFAIETTQAFCDAKYVEWLGKHE
ncbi:MAG: glycosyltransferase [bacterium]|nr:glycosyltransferase [bacterium]